MKKFVLLMCALTIAGTAAGCEDASGLAAAINAQASSEPQSLQQRRALRDEAEIGDLPALPTFTFEPIHVATPVPVFADSVSQAPSAPSPGEDASQDGVQGEEMPDTSGVDALETSPSGQLYAGRTITVRWVDTANGRLMETVYSVPRDVTSEDLMKYVTKGLRTALVDQKIQIVSASMSDGLVTVDFAPGIYLLGLSSQDELQMLESIADSYLRSVDGIRGVVFTVEGAPYHSDHIEIPEGEPYKVLEPAAT